MAKEPRLNKDGTPDKRYKAPETPTPDAIEPIFRNQGGKIQEIIDSRQAPGVVIPAQHQSAPKPGAGVDPNKALDWSHLNKNGQTANVIGG